MNAPLVILFDGAASFLALHPNCNGVRGGSRDGPNRAVGRHLGAKHELHRITEVLYESCWRLARTNLEQDVSVTSFFQALWRDGGSLAYWEERGDLKQLLGQIR